MKKNLGILIAAVLLMIPVSATATTIGTAQLDVEWSTPTGGGYYLDYDGVLTYNGITTSGEIFCVENQDAPDDAEEYTLMTIDTTVLMQAAWIADNYAAIADEYKYSYSDDEEKAEAQKAIWALTGVMDITKGLGLDAYILKKLANADLSNYDPGNWVLAVNDTYQNYLVSNPASPVPEPATLLLLGSGLFGLLTSRKKMFKK